MKGDALTVICLVVLFIVWAVVAVVMTVLIATGPPKHENQQKTVIIRSI